MDTNVEFYNSCVQSFETVTNKPELFISSNDNLADGIKKQLKLFYDFSKKEEIKTIKSDALSQLITENFDLEQIWQQIELQNNSLLTRSLANVSRLVVNKSQLLFKNFEQFGNESAEPVEKGDEEQMEIDGDNDDDDENMAVSNSDNSSLSDEELSDEPENTAENKKFKSSEVDDDFFKLNEMENFLKAEEKKLNEPDSGNDSEQSESEASLDLFEAETDDDDDDEDNKVKTAKYKDFFVANEVIEKKVKRNKFMEEFEQNDSEDENNQKQSKSTFELRQERLNKKIEEIEEDVVDEKPWQLKGEITAENRPQNSLLEEIVEFDLTSRPAPVMTEQTTFQLEDIIRQRIKDKVFDSVERKLKPIDTPLEYKKKLVLNQEKSKESLAQIYEKEYLEQKAALDPENADKEEEIPKLHQEINSMMNNLFRQLDALSNFHFTPKPALPELKIINNLPAINMEEVAPVAVSDAALLAPEEVKGKARGDVIGKSERTTADKKRERRMKKRKQKEHAKKKEKNEKLINKIKPGLGNKYSKEKAKEMLANVTKNNNIDLMDESSGAKHMKSSKAFFTELQDEAQSQIKSKLINKKSNVNKKSFNAKKMKL